MPELLKEWCGTEKLSGTYIGMIPGIRQTHEKQSMGGVELIKVVQDDGCPADIQQTAPTPRISSMPNPAKAEGARDEVRQSETNKEIENMMKKMETRLMQRKDALEAKMMKAIGEERRYYEHTKICA